MITVVGEALMDLVRPLGDAGAPAEYPGGSPANVALGLARLGTPATLLTQLGEDDRGAAIRRHLASSGVAVRPLGGAGPTSTATAILDQRGGASYEFAIAWDPPAEPRPEPGTTCLHTGSLATALEPGASAVEAMVERERGATISFDPNIRPSLMDSPEAVRPRIERLVAMADVVKVSDEDLAWLYPGQDLAGLASRWRRSGPAIVVVTLGGEGCLALSAAAESRRPGMEVAVRDTVGAGDAFTSGLLHCLARLGLLGGARRDALRDITTEQLGWALDTATATAAFTCSRAGAEPPTLAELEAFTA